MWDSSTVFLALSYGLGLAFALAALGLFVIGFVTVFPHEHARWGD